MPLLNLPRVLPIPTASTEAGDLTFIENGEAMPFVIARIFYIYNVPKDRKRAGHALRRCAELLIAVKGAFTVELVSQAGEKFVFQLQNPTSGLFVPALYWRTLSTFADDTVCLVLASEIYDEQEYIRDYDEFRQYASRNDSIS